MLGNVSALSVSEMEDPASKLAIHKAGKSLGKSSFRHIEDSITELGPLRLIALHNRHAFLFKQDYHKVGLLLQQISNKRTPKLIPLPILLIKPRHNKIRIDNLQTEILMDFPHSRILGDIVVRT